MKKISLILIISLLTFSIGCGDPLPVEPQTQTSGTVSEDQNDVTSTVSSEVSEPEVSVSEPEPEPVHEHNIVCESNGDGTHTNKCISTDGLDCEFEETTEDCELNSEYVCEKCGFQHVHELAYSQSGADEQKHTVNCTLEDCDYEETVECALNEDYVCTECGRDYSYTVEPIEEKTMYATTAINIRSIPDKSGELVKKVNTNDELVVTGLVKSFKGNDVKFYQLKDGSFADGRFVSETKVEIKVEEPKVEEPKTEDNTSTTTIVAETPQLKTGEDIKSYASQLSGVNIYKALISTTNETYVDTFDSNECTNILLSLFNVDSIDKVYDRMKSSWKRLERGVFAGDGYTMTIMLNTQVAFIREGGDSIVEKTTKTNIYPVKDDAVEIHLESLPKDVWNNLWALDKALPKK